jgi:hypothetical protein
MHDRSMHDRNVLLFVANGRAYLCDEQAEVERGAPSRARAELHAVRRKSLGVANRGCELGHVAAAHLGVDKVVGRRLPVQAGRRERVVLCRAGDAEELWVPEQMRRVELTCTARRGFKRLEGLQTVYEERA